MSFFDEKMIQTLLLDSTNDIQILQTPNFSTDFENELLFFFKPDCFINKKPEDLQKIIELIENKFKEYDVEISGAVSYSGNALLENKIMQRHYGFINRLSNEASKIVTQEEKDIIFKRLDLTDPSIKLLGGHEFLNEFSQFDEFSLKSFWLSKDTLKFRSGFYFHLYDVDGEQVVIVNGFHPAQLKHFTASDRKILLLLLHSNNDWKNIKDDMIGNTYPEKATLESIRGNLYFRKDFYNTPTMAVSNNHVHLSAGPFEALFELHNFFSPIEELKSKIYESNVGEKIQSLGFKVEDIVQNPYIEEYSNDLFSESENINTSDAIHLLK